MELTKNNIVNWINKRVVSYRVSWDDIVDYLDMAIDEINSYMSTKYPHVSLVLNEYAPTEKTYSYRAGGIDVEFFPGKYFTSIVMPYAITQILTTDEEFTMIYSKYMSQYQENLFVMARDEMNNIPYQFISAPKGVYFANPDPQFKQNPEKYFNQQIIMDIPKIRVFYSWGNYKSMLPFNVQTFVEKPLPKDPNAYETGFKYMPIMMAGENYSTYIVDYAQKVLGVFLGWSLKDDNKAEGIVQSPIDLYEDTTFYAVFDLDIVGIEYNGNGGTIHNWRPTYVTKSEFNANALLPMGGTAFRKGYRFVGFELEKTNEFTLEEEYDGFEEENDVVAEPGVTFKALWYKMLYNISYVGAKGIFTTTKINYTFGQEFDLDLPVESESEPDEFIGWWDNPQFLGDRITKINESDYGDKTFYAKYNEEKYRIRWLAEDETIIKEDFLTRGTFLTEPEGMVKDNAWINFFESQDWKKETLYHIGEKFNNGKNEYEVLVNHTSNSIINELESGKIIKLETVPDYLLYKFEYVGFINEYNEYFQPGITKAKRNTDLHVVFSQPIPVETNLVIHYLVKEEDVVSSKQEVIRKQVGTEIDVDIDIILFLTNEGFNTYENESDIQQFVKSVSFIINGTASEEELVSGMTFIMNEEKTYQVSCNYDTSSWAVNFIKKTYSGGVYSLGASAGTHSFADNTTKAVIENKGASYLDILYEVELSQDVYEYLQGFKVLGEEDVETDMPTNIGSDLTLVPYYGPTVNTAFVKILKLEGMPMMDSLTKKQTITQHHRVGTVVDLNSIKATTETNQYKYLKVDKFFSTSNNGSLEDEVTSGEIELLNNKTLYIQTANKKLYSVIYKNYSSPSITYNLKVIDYYPFNFQSGNVLFNTQTNQPEVTSYLGARHIHKGWSTTNGGAVNDLVVHLLENRGSDLILYPIFVRLGDFIINYSFRTLDSTPLLTDYTLQSTRMTTDKKKIDYEDYINIIGSNKVLFDSYNGFVQDLNSKSELLSNTQIQPQQIGYKLHSYKVNNGTAVESENIVIPIPQRTEVEGKDANINLEIILTRDPAYAHLVIGDSSKPNDKLSSDDIDRHTGTVAYQRNKFIIKRVPFSELISNGQIPTLSSYEGKPLYYCYWNASEPFSISDVIYNANVVGDMEIFVKDTVEGLHQFRIIYQESNGAGGFTTLKTMHIYENQLAQYGSVWAFDINLYKPSDPGKYGYIFKGYSSPVSNGAVVTSYGISTGNTQDVYFTAVYNLFGYINVNFKVRAESGNLITDYDLTGDLNWSNMGAYAFSKRYTFFQRSTHHFSPTPLINEFRNAIDYNQRAQMGYDVVGFEVSYPAGVIGTGESSYLIASYVDPYVELNNVLNSAIDGKDCDITFTFILRRKSGYVHVEVLNQSQPSLNTGSLDSYNYPYRKFFMDWGETILDVRNDFNTNYGEAQNPIYDLSIYGVFSNYYTYNTGGGYLLVNTSFQANSSIPQNIQIFVRDDI